MVDHKVATPPGKSRDTAHADPRIAKSRRALHAALLALVTEAPFEEVTVAAITKRAGIGYATFFRHYPSPEALLADIADQWIGELLARVAPLIVAQDTRAAALALASFVEARRPLCRALLVGAGEVMRRDITARAIAAAGGVEAPVQPWLPRDLGIAHGVAATLAILRWWLEADRQEDAAAVADIIDRLVFAPLAQAADA